MATRGADARSRRDFPTKLEAVRQKIPSLARWRTLKLFGARQQELRAAQIVGGIALVLAVCVCSERWLGLGDAASRVLNDSHARVHSLCRLAFPDATCECLSTDDLLTKGVHLALVCALAAFALHACRLVGVWPFRRPVYLLDFATYEPPPEYEVSFSKFSNRSRAAGAFSEESMEFQERMLYRSGLSEHTFFPASLSMMNPPQPTMARAREEALEVLGGAVQKALDACKLRPRDIDVLVVNCSLFCPTPSLAAMVVNRFRMRSDVVLYNLGGMGCSSSPLAVALARDLLRTRRLGGRALVCSMENITQNWYRGQERSMLVSNTIFRMGGAAMILSTWPWDRLRAKYELEHIVRVHRGANDEAYRCIYQCEDDNGVIGVRLTPEILGVAARVVRLNITMLAPRILPIDEIVRYGVVLVASVVDRLRGRKPRALYVPDFTKAAQHICIHAGGRAVLEVLQRELHLDDTALAASYFALHRMGNTSSSSIWYELGFHEAGGVSKGDRVWQLAFGSGFKCNSITWRALRTIIDERNVIAL